MGNRVFNLNNLHKTVRYLRKNGVRHAWYAARERIEEEKRESYRYRAPSAETLAEQRRRASGWPWLFSIVVPAYETKEEFLQAMMDSVLGQSYEKWELIIVDASAGASVEDAVRRKQEDTGDGRIRYRHLRENKGISGNTNAGIGMAAGDYIALLDHDDLLAPDALYHMAAALQDGRRQGTEPALLYSDEDKYDGGSGQYVSPHRKTDFNLDLLLSNNYICHFMAVEAGLMKELGLREQYDGAQDYDLVLRVTERLYESCRGIGLARRMVHVPEILYHWRCHAGSTADNTASKAYAYEAGKRALEDFCGRLGWKVQVSHSLHLGFYEICYLPDILTARPDVGIAGGRILDRRGRICGGAYREDGTCMYRGLPKEYSGGRTHRAALKQDVCAADIRCMQVSAGLREAYEQITGLQYRERTIYRKAGGRKTECHIADLSGLSCDEAGFCKLSMELGRAARAKGYLVVWDPGTECVL